MSYVCPDCKSENIQQIALIYGSGTSQVTSRSSAVGLDLQGHIGVGAISSKGASQSALAQRFAPPKKADARSAIGCLIFVGLVAGLIAWAIYGSFVYLPLAIGAAGLLVGFIENAVKKHNNTIYRPQYEAWLRKFACLRCGSVFERPNSDSADSGSKYFRIMLTSAGSQKVAAIKAIRDITGLDLRSARDVAERAPWELKAKATKIEAETAKRRLEEIGATVDIRPV